MNYIKLGAAAKYPYVQQQIPRVSQYIHSTPEHFGVDKSQAMIGVQMASAYCGTCLMPPLFGLIANHVSVSLLPAYMFVILVLMAVMHERLLVKARKEKV